MIRTWTLAAQRFVMLLILEPVTPGGLRLSMDCRLASSSATADDMVGEIATTGQTDSADALIVTLDVFYFNIPLYPVSSAITSGYEGSAMSDSSDGHYNLGEDSMSACRDQKIARRVSQSAASMTMITQRGMLEGYRGRPGKLDVRGWETDVLGNERRCRQRRWRWWEEKSQFAGRHCASAIT
jgi:hypothetical protein